MNSDLFYTIVGVLALVAIAVFYFSPFDLKIEEEED